MIVHHALALAHKEQLRPALARDVYECLRDANAAGKATDEREHRRALHRAEQPKYGLSFRFRFV